MPPTTPLVEVSFTTIDPPASRVVLPHTPSSVSISVAVDWSRSQPLQWSGEHLSYRGTKSPDIEIAAIEPWADTEAESEEIERRIAQLMSLAYAPASATQIGGLTRPPRFVVDWPGLMSVVVVIQRLVATRTQFFPGGAPRRWSISGQYVEWVEGRRTRESVLRGGGGFARGQGRVE